MAENSGCAPEAIVCLSLRSSSISFGKDDEKDECFTIALGALLTAGLAEEEVAEPGARDDAITLSGVGPNRTDGDSASSACMAGFKDRGKASLEGAELTWFNLPPQDVAKTFVLFEHLIWGLSCVFSSLLG